MILLNDFSFLKIKGFEKPKCWKDVDKTGPSAVIHDSGEGNDRPMCKLGVRVNLQHIY
jgi:hypothetical protein